MFNVNPRFNVLHIQNSEDIASHNIPKQAIADIRPAVVMGTDNLFSQHVVVVEKNNGQLVTIPMGTVSEQPDWANNLSGVNHCVSVLVDWLNS